MGLGLGLGLGCAWDWFTCAARGGHLKVLQWARALAASILRADTAPALQPCVRRACTRVACQSSAA